MLVLTRKCQETVVISRGDGADVMVKLTVLSMERGKVRLGFEAEGDVAINRLEVFERIRDEVGAAAD